MYSLIEQESKKRRNYQKIGIIAYCEMSILRVKQKLQSGFLKSDKLSSLLTLAINFEVFDKNNKNVLSFEGFISCFPDTGFTPSIQDSRTLFQYYDNQGEVEYRQVISFIRGSISQRRKGFIITTFGSIDKDNDGIIAGADLAYLFSSDASLRKVVGVINSLGDSWNSRRIDIDSYVYYISCLGAFLNDDELEAYLKNLIQSTYNSKSVVSSDVRPKSLSEMSTSLNQAEHTSTQTINRENVLQHIYKLVINSPKVSLLKLIEFQRRLKQHDPDRSGLTSLIDFASSFESSFSTSLPSELVAGLENYNGISSGSGLSSLPYQQVWSDILVSLYIICCLMHTFYYNNQLIVTINMLTIGPTK